jgi:1-acyl-sn-glycerol-3-phosphate acyltransferase/nucleoside-diphosphate-sugar epimerase
MQNATTETIYRAISTDSMQSAGPKLTIIAADYRLGEVIAEQVAQSNSYHKCDLVLTKALASSDRLLSDTTVVYLPSLHEKGMVPDLIEASNVLRQCLLGRACWFVLISSAAIYDASFRNPGLMTEFYPMGRNQGAGAIAAKWRKLEAIVNRQCNTSVRLTILRCSTVLARQCGNRIASRFVRWAATTLPGHDPCVQLLSPKDLASAIDCILQNRAVGVFNVGPNGVIPMRQALKKAGTRRIPVPRTILRVGHALCGRSSANYLDFMRYPWTVSNEKIKAIGFSPQLSSADALAEFCQQPSEIFSDANHQFDDFGMDRDYIEFYRRTLFKFLADSYWRIEVAGIENIPQSGRAVLAGTHRGFMPWDGVMALHEIVERAGRYPRFLIHPGLVKFPFLANFMTKLGGIIACQENAERVLKSDELLGVFPEGIQGAFALYSQAYQLHDFYRDAFVKIALRYQAPIVPFVTVGSAEIFPILAKVRSRLWTKYSEWPAFPITPTFPFIPLPLPSKWHMQFLPALHIQKDYPPSAAADTGVVRSISAQVRNRMQNALEEMLLRRRSIFFGSIFKEEAVC